MKREKDIMKINIIIAKRGRDDYLKLALHNFNQADNIERYNINVYIGEDIEENVNKIDYSIYNNLKVHHLYIPNLPQAGDLFCRGHIMDMLLRQMRQDYDFICVADTDMIYRKSFFDDITVVLSHGGSINRCLVAKGAYTAVGTDYNKILQNQEDYDSIIQNHSHQPAITASQISLTKGYHELINKKLRVNSIFDTGSLGYYFIGWGREDTLVDKIMAMSRAEVVNLEKAWVHIWHPPQEAEALSYNTSILSVLEEEAKERAKASRLYIHPLRKKLKAYFTRRRMSTSTKV